MCMQMCAEPPPGIAASASAAAITAGAASAATPPASGPQADLLASLGLGGTGCGSQTPAVGPHVPPVGTELRGCSKGSEKVCMGGGTHILEARTYGLVRQRLRQMACGLMADA